MRWAWGLAGDGVIGGGSIQRFLAANWLAEIAPVTCSRPSVCPASGHRDTPGRGLDQRPSKLFAQVPVHDRARAADFTMGA